MAENNSLEQEAEQGPPILNYGLFCFATITHLCTILITWPVWQARVTPPNLSLFEVPQFSFGLPIVCLLIYQIWDPKRGFPIQILFTTMAIVCDQFRLQPQFLHVLVLMWGTFSMTGLNVARWSLASLWFWAGLHKLLSVHWFGHSSFWILRSMGFDEELTWSLHWPFAFFVGMSELVLGLLAIFNLRVAAFGCIALHSSIFLLMLGIQWNYSVLPWNLATAVVGFWVLWTQRHEADSSLTPNRHRPSSFAYLPIAAILFLVPVGFYWGWTDRVFASVLYSDNLPKGIITRESDLQKIEGWESLRVPFPRNHRNLKQFFELTAKPGEKLHIFDPRDSIEDQFLLMTQRGSEPVSRNEFFDQTESIPGIGIDDPNSRFWLKKWGKFRYRNYNDQNESTDNLISTAYAMNPKWYSVDALQLLSGLPNLRQLQLKNCPVEDEHLAIVAELFQLEGLVV